MKLLFLFTLLSACCYGQGDIHTVIGLNAGDTAARQIFIGEPYNYSGQDTSAPFENPPTSKVIIEGNIIMDFSSKEDKIYNLLTINQLLLYAQECYNDSTLKIIYHAPERYLDGYIGGHNEKIYIHREPTLEGFIEWLKKK